jgi:hypothetical protein
MYLADCYAQNGQTASAWAMFKEAATAANAANQKDRARTATQKADELEKKLAYVAITFASGADVAGLEVKRDGDVVGKATIGTKLPVDPGKHTFEASAPGKKPWSTTIEIPNAPGSTTVTIPALADAPADAAPATPADGAKDQPPPAAPQGADAAQESGWPAQKTAALVAGGVGVVGVAIGAIFGVMTISSWGTAQDTCADEGEDALQCDEAGVDAGERAKTNGTISTIGFIVGGVGLAAGVVLWVTAPSGSPEKTGKSIRVTPALGPGIAGLEVGGRF